MNYGTEHLATGENAYRTKHLTSENADTVTYSSRLSTFQPNKTKKERRKGFVLFHYGFEVFVGGGYGHDVEFVDEYLEDVGGYECG